MADAASRWNPAVVFDAIEAQQREVRELADASIKEVEAQRDDRLGQLERARVALDGDRPGSTRSRRSPLSDARPAAPPKRRRRRRSPSSQAALLQRREAIVRYLGEQQGPVPRSQICSALKTAPSATRAALNRLLDEGRIVRTGTGSSIRYAAKGGLSAVPSVAEGGTLQGRLLALIEDRGSASLDELDQAIDVPREQILKACGSLIREEEIEMGQRDGRPVYVVRMAA
jgi:predicted transcriptional regulator